MAWTQSSGAAALDQYGGSTALQCTNTTGHFIVTEINNRWWFCTPAGHVLISNSVGNILTNTNPTYDCRGQNTYNIYINKYGDTTYGWGWQQLRRMTAWGFNSVGQDSGPFVLADTTCQFGQDGCVWPGGVTPIKLPYLTETKPAEYAMVNTNGYLTEPIKDLLNGANANYTTWRGGSVPDVFDAKLSSWWNQFLQSSTNANLRSNDPWILGLFTDDSDYFWGAGAGPDYATGHTNANLGWTTLIVSPTQTYVQSTSFEGGRFIYTDTTVHMKANATSPSTCSVSSPCSLRDYLWQKYGGSIAGLNSAWGSNYTTFDSTGTQVTGELVGTGDGNTTVFTHTIAHTPLSPDSVLVLVGGTAQAGDCPWFISACQAGGPALLTTTGTLGSPASNYLNQVQSTINYSTGALTITFVAAPASGMAITLNYIYQGWMSGGSGLMDESGANTTWVGTNPFCLEGADPNYPTYFSCVGGGGLNNPVPNANAALGADLDAWVSQVAAQYFKTMYDDLRTVSQLPYLGLDTIGSWSVPAYSKFLQGATPYIDAAFVGLQWWLPTPSPAAFQSAYQYTTQYLGDVPLLNFSAPVAQADSSMSCYPNPNIGDLGTQQNRGQQYYNTVNYLLNTPGFNGTYPFVGFDWWSWQDFQQLNQGLVSIHDNAYNGKEAITGNQPCSPERVQNNYQCGNEAANYGDCLASVENANALWHSLLSAGMRGPTKVTELAH